MTKIETHADDYGLTMEASKKILQCVKEGKLSAVSILPNLSCFEEAALLWNNALTTCWKTAAGEPPGLWWQKSRHNRSTYASKNGLRFRFP